MAPYCAALRERLRHGNIPMWVHIHTGLDAWERAKHPNSTAGDCASSVWDGSGYDWPVQGCFVRVEIDHGPSVEQCQRFAVELLEQGARVVLLWWFDKMPQFFCSNGASGELEISDLQQVFQHEST